MRLGVFLAVTVQDARLKYYSLLSTPEETLIEEYRGNELLSPLVQRVLKAKRPMVKSSKTLTDYKHYIQLFIEKHGGEESASVAHLTALNAQKLHIHRNNDLRR